MIRGPETRLLLRGLQETLRSVGIDYDALIAEFGQVRAAEQRAKGRSFGLDAHVRGLVFSLLSSQRPWGPIARSLEQVETIFLAFDPILLSRSSPESLVQGVRALGLGNRRIEAQMKSLAPNIRTLRRIESEHDSLDAFVTSSDADTVALVLSKAGSPYKLNEIGYTLALEYLRNVGIRAGKPDVHMRRVLSSERLGYSAGYPNEREAYELLAQIAGEVGCSPTYIDNLLWLFCAKDYGGVCGAKPKCDICGLADVCAYPVGAESRPESSPET